jgi:hypothetical protein
VPLAQLPYGGDAIHLRHLDVHRHDVRLEHIDLRLGEQAVGCRTDHLDALGVAERVDDEAADDHGVVDHEHGDH